MKQTMSDNAKIKNELLDQMVIGKEYELQELYKIIDNMEGEIEDADHKLRALLEGVLKKGEISKNYTIERCGKAMYRLVKI